MTEEVKNLLEDYMAAAANLYGIIPLWKFLEIYNSQNEPVTESEFREFVENLDTKDKYYDFVGQEDIDENAPETEMMNKEIVAEYLYMEDWDEYKAVKELQKMADYYIPKKERFLRYKDDFFYEKALEFIDVRAFLRNLPYMSKEEADGIAEDTLFLLQIDNENDITSAVQNAIRLGLKDSDKAKLKEFCGLVMELNDNVRKNCYLGHTRKEVFGDIF